MHTREKKKGPDGVFLLREVSKRIRYPDHT